MKLRSVFSLLYQKYGPQKWWPAKTKFEVCVGAILTQNTSWKNVESAIKNLRNRKMLTKRALLNTKIEEIEMAIKSSGFYRQKARRLITFCERVDLNKLEKIDVRSAREYLLSINGIGKETADSMLLYALNKPIFVVDAYTKRIYGRMFSEKNLEYDELREIFENELGKNVAILNEMHALIVQHAKIHCTKTKPRCADCPLSKICDKDIN